MTAVPFASEPAPTLVEPDLGPGRTRWLDPWALGLAALSAVLVWAGFALGWRGGDMPAQIYRMEAVRRHGYALWDSQWFAGHWVLGYSVIEPALAALVGLAALSVVSAAVASAGFHRLVADHFGVRAARAAALVFAVSVVVETAIGQVPFLAGEAVGLWSCVALARRRPGWAAAAALLSSLLSPLAAAFVAVVAGAWALSLWWPRTPPALLPAGVSRGRALLVRLRRPGAGTAVAVLAAIGIPLGLVGLLFPGQGPMPFSTVDCGWDLLVALGLLCLTPLSDRVLRSGLALYGLVTFASLGIPSALGGNVGRIEDAVALPLLVALVVSRWDDLSGRAVVRRLAVRPSRTRRVWLARRLVAAFAFLPLLVSSQWAPAWEAMTSDAGHAWMSPGYYQPLTAYLHRVMGPGGRVEVVPTADHWESAYVAPTVALARGWERQLDVADNPIFYQPGELNDTSYLSWLLDNGVRYVALPSAPLDYAGQGEAQLVEAGVPGLREVWQTASWRVFKVEGSTGIVSGPGYLTHIDGSKLTIVADYPGTIEVRVHDNDGWQVSSGDATLEPSSDGWILVNAIIPGPIDLSLGLDVP